MSNYEWTPVKDKLPIREDLAYTYKFVLGTTNTGNVGLFKYAYETESFIMCACSLNNFIPENATIIAWCELPKAYSKGENNGKTNHRRHRK